MVKKNNIDNISNDAENTNNLQLNLNLDNLDDEKVKKEVFDLYEAINEGKIDLNPEEKKEILQELDLIINHLSNDEIKENLAIDDSSDALNDVIDNDSVEDSDFVGHVDVDDALEDLVDESSVDDSASVNSLVFKDSVESVVVDDSISIDESSVEDSTSVGEDSVLVGGAVSVVDALNDLVDDYSDEVAISVKNLSMEFKVSKDKIDTLKEFVIRTIKRNKSGTKIVTALEDVSFDIPKGDRVGIIGFNGAGKSTLLKILAGVYDATEGTIETKGKIAPLLELGAGFDPNYTGKNNIFLNGAFLGYSEDFIKEKYDEILEFSELGDAINYHVKTYSSGMRAKLGFSIATMVEPDILILDEILSVGDIRFRRKSADKIRSLINSGITVLLVSHSVAQIRDLCNKAIWIDEGKLKMYGEVNKVCDAYTKAASKATREQLKNIELD